MSQPSSCSGGQFPQKAVNQGPVYSKKIKVYRPNKTALKQKGRAPNWVK
jgi:hypothetical protein